MRPLIIHSNLVCPPTWFPSFRDLTLVSSIFLHLDVLMAAEPHETDMYYHFMRARGGMDFVRQIVRPGEENGVCIDSEPRFAPTIITDRIAPENVHRIIQNIRGVYRV